MHKTCFRINHINRFARNSIEMFILNKLTGWSSLSLQPRLSLATLITLRTCRTGLSICSIGS